MVNQYIYLPCYQGKISTEPVHDLHPLKLMSGPLIPKTDAAPSSLCDKDASIEFCEELAEKGIHVIFSIPNDTTCTAEMDQLFEKF